MDDQIKTLVVTNAKEVLSKNRVSGVSEWEGRPFNFVCPSRQTYPFQWFWDSAFHAVALLSVDTQLAKQELLTLLSASQEDGFIPHMVLWTKDFHQKALNTYLIRLAHPFFTATIQPPVIARSVFRIYQKDPDKLFLSTVLPKVDKFFTWLKSNRDPDGDHLISIIQPDESGLDACSKYDKWMKLESGPKLAGAMNFLFENYRQHQLDSLKILQLDLFNWEDVMVNCIYADGLICLSKLYKQLGEIQKASHFQWEADRVTKALMDKCWDTSRGVFWDLFSAKEHQVKILTFSSLFPLILENLDATIADRIVSEHLLNPAEFLPDFPFPSVSLDEESFIPDFANQTLWRGPSWININWYFWQRLKDIPRYQKIAEMIAQKTIQLVATSGVREFYNPFTAQGYGAWDFGWSCLVLDMIDYYSPIN